MLQEEKIIDLMAVIPLNTEFGIQMRFLGATNSQEIIILLIFEGCLEDYLPGSHSGQGFQV